MNSFIIHGFDSPVWLITGSFIVLFMLYVLLFKQKRENFLQGDLIQQVYGRNSFWYNIFIILVFGITILLFLIGAGPYSNITQQINNRQGIDIEIVFDLSYSMLAEDLSPNRLEVAKKVFSDFVSALENDRVGLILFSGKPFHSVPLSYDYNFLKNFMKTMSIDTINQQYKALQGSSTGDAILLASDILTKDRNDREKIIILVTDGQSEGGIDPEIALRFAVSKNIKIYTIGIGTLEGTSLQVYIPESNTFQDKQVLLDEGFLQHLSLESQGKYFRVDGEEVFWEILRSIGQLERNKIDIKEQKKYYSLKKVYLYILISLFGLLGYIVFFKGIRFS